MGDGDGGGICGCGLSRQSVNMAVSMSRRELVLTGSGEREALA